MAGKWRLWGVLACVLAVRPVLHAQEMERGGGGPARGVASELTVAPQSSAANGALDEAAASPDASVGAALFSLGQRAAAAFTGQVIDIRPDGMAVNVVFRRDVSLVGTGAGQFTLREWAGLWPAGAHRYWVGERAAIFVNPVGRAGLSSPVDGAEGVVPIVLSDAGDVLLDIRRLSARLLRASGEALADATNGAITLADAKVAIATGADPVRHPLPVGAAPGSGDGQQPVLPLRPVRPHPVWGPVVDAPAARMTGGAW